MSVVAAIRPSNWDFALFIHIAGAMFLVASLIIAADSIRIARTKGDQPATQWAYRTMWRGVLPSYIVMRVGAEIIVSKEKLSDSDDAWIGIGFITSDLGLLLIIIATVIAGLAARKAKAGESVSGSKGLAVSGGLATFLVLVYVVTIWAMTTKPT
jgi:hypothetical protein